MFSYTTNIAKSDSPFSDNCHIEKLSWVAINLQNQKSAEKWVKNLENGKKVVNLQCK